MDTLTKALTADLRSRDKHRRDSALRRIHALPEEDAIKTLIELMDTLPNYRFPWITRFALHLLALVLIFASLLVISRIAGIAFLPYRGMAIYVLIDFLTSSQGDRKISGKTEWVTPLLPHYSDTRLIAPCLSEWKASQGKKRGFLEACLVRNLPLLTPEIAEKMAMEKRKQLRELVFVESLALQCVTLQTLLQIEDVNAIPNVETLLKNTPNSEVQEAAEACLSGLRELKQREKDREVLLRPSLEKNGKEVLLRPATSRHDEDEQQLLRPGSGEE